MKTEYPTTVLVAVQSLLNTVSPEEQLKVLKMCRDGLFMFQFSLGTRIRHDVGLNNGNQQLIDDSGETEVDQVCVVIIRAFWTHLHVDPDYQNWHADVSI